MISILLTILGDRNPFLFILTPLHIHHAWNIAKKLFFQRKALSIVRSKGIKFDKEDEKSTKKSPENMTKINERVLQDISAEGRENIFI